MEILYIVVGIIALLLIIYIVISISNNKKINKAVFALEKTIDGLTVKKAEKKPFDYQLTYQGKTIYVSVFIVPNQGNVTINNKYIWQILDGHSKFRTIDAVKPFMDSLEKNKLALLYPSISQLRKWVNESEMIKVEGSTDIYGAKVAGITNIDLIRNEISYMK